MKTQEPIYFSPAGESNYSSADNRPFTIQCYSPDCGWQDSRFGGYTLTETLHTANEFDGCMTATTRLRVVRTKGYKPLNLALK